jgi:hypothetical protein
MSRAELDTIRPSNFTEPLFQIKRNEPIMATAKFDKEKGSIDELMIKLDRQEQDQKEIIRKM